MKTPLVSVVIPAYNSASTIEACLGSVMGQSFKDFEVVVVDNRSTDRTRSIIKRAQKKDGRVRYILEKVQGRGPARNKGLRSARGEVLVWTDSDCTVPSDWLEKLARPILDGKAEAVQGGQSSMVEGLWSRLAQRADLRHFKAHVYKKKYIDHVDTKNLGIRKAVLVEAGGFDPRLRALEDFELKVRLKQAGRKVLYLPHIKVKHRHRSTFGALMRSRVEQGYWAAIVYYLHKDFFDKEGQRDSTIRFMYLGQFLSAMARSLRFLFRYGPGDLMFEVVTGAAWRWGGFKARGRRDEFKDAYEATAKEVSR